MYTFTESKPIPLSHDQILCRIQHLYDYSAKQVDDLKRKRDHCCFSEIEKKELQAQYELAAEVFDQVHSAFESVVYRAV